MCVWNNREYFELSATSGDCDRFIDKYYFQGIDAAKWIGPGAMVVNESESREVQKIVK